MSHGADSLKSIIFALCANLAIAIAKGVAAVITGSGAMLAEAIHSLADTGNQGLSALARFSAGLWQGDLHLVVSGRDHPVQRRRAVLAV